MEFGERSARQEASAKNNNPPVFVPGIGAGHQLSKRRSIEGTFVKQMKAKKERRKHLGIFM